MNPQIATTIIVAGILALFLLDRDPKARTSKALWIPVIWLWIVASREVSQWMVAFGSGQMLLSDSPDLEGNPFDRNVYATLLALGLIVLITRRAQVRQLLRSNLPIILFFVYCGVSAMWSDYPGLSFKRWIKSVGDIVMLMVVLTETNRVVAVKRFLARAAFLLIPLSVLFIKFYPALGRWYKNANGNPVYIGVTTNKNILGAICLLFGLASLWRFLAAYQDRKDPRRIRRLIVHGVFLGMVLWLFGMAGSMTGLACFLLAGGLLVATNFRMVARKPALIHLLVAAVVLVSFTVLFFGVDAGALQAMGKDPTLTGRTAIWTLVLSLTGNPLIGAGFESFWLPGWRRDKIWDAYWWHPNEAHNGYIEVFLNLGWIGLVLLAIILVTGYRKVVAAVSLDPDLGRLRLAYFVVGVVYNFTEAGFRMLDPVWLTFLLAVMAAPRIGVRPVPIFQLNANGDGDFRQQK